MRVFAVFFFALLFSAAAFAADLKIKVLDPHLAAVSGAQVELLRDNDSRTLATQITSAEGIVSLPPTRSWSLSGQGSGPGIRAGNHVEFPRKLSSR